MKSISDIRGVPNTPSHNLKGLLRKGSIPDSQKSAFLKLYVCQNVKDRLTKEIERLGKEKLKLEKKNSQINLTLAEINKRMTALFKLAEKGGGKSDEAVKSKKHTVLEY